MTQRPPLPDPTKRIVRKEGFFGCVVCGNPLIEYSHIIPYSKSHDDSPENLVPLCPTHHAEYDNEAISEKRMREFKANPYNKNRDVGERFYIEGDKPIIEIGSNIFENTPIPLVIDSKNIVSLYKEENELLLNALFYDMNNNLLASIKDNEWCASSGMVWDIEYHTTAKALIVRTKPKDILLRLKISKGIVHLSGALNYNGLQVRMFPTRVIGKKTVSLRHCKFSNVIAAVAFDTRTGGFEIATSRHEHEFKKQIIAQMRRDYQHGRRYEPVFIMKECRHCGRIFL
jgi:hypothetical protein